MKLQVKEQQAAKLRDHCKIRVKAGRDTITLHKAGGWIWAKDKHGFKDAFQGYPETREGIEDMVRDLLNFRDKEKAQTIQDGEILLLEFTPTEILDEMTVKQRQEAAKEIREKLGELKLDRELQAKQQA